MGKKTKVASKKVKGKKSAAENTAPKKTRKHFNKCMRMSLSERNAFFEELPSEDLIRMIEESYTADLVHLWIDMKKSVVRDLFRRVIKKKRTLILPAITLYQYKEYLTNPLPLVLDAVGGGDIPNYYALVGMDRESSEEELREARKLLRQAHAESLYSRSEQATARKRLKEIDEAFAALTTREKRQVTDTRLPSIHYLYPKRDQSWLTAVTRVVNG